MVQFHVLVHEIEQNPRKQEAHQEIIQISEERIIVSHNLVDELDYIEPVEPVQKKEKT